MQIAIRMEGCNNTRFPPSPSHRIKHSTVFIDTYGKLLFRSLMDIFVFLALFRARVYNGKANTLPYVLTTESRPIVYGSIIIAKYYRLKSIYTGKKSYLTTFSNSRTYPINRKCIFNPADNNLRRVEAFYDIIRITRARREVYIYIYIEDFKFAI